MQTIKLIVAHGFRDLHIYFNVGLMYYFVVMELLLLLFACVGELRHFSNVCLVHHVQNFNVNETF